MKIYEVSGGGANRPIDSRQRTRSRMHRGWKEFSEALETPGGLAGGMKVVRRYSVRKRGVSIMANHGARWTRKWTGEKVRENRLENNASRFTLW